MTSPRVLLRKSLIAALTTCLAVGLLLFSIGFYRATLQAPPPTLLLNDRHGVFLAELNHSRESENEQGYGYWPLQQLPPRVVAATLAIEDRHFWSHPGIDPVGIGRALWQNLSNTRRISGASTIAMQVARMQAPAQRNYINKIIEAATALALTLRHGREGVLRHYLRLVPYGNNIHGIAYAARRYLDKPVQDLSWAEIAFLSAIPQSPGRMNPYDGKGKRRAIKRGKRILAQLHQQALINDAEWSLASRQIEFIEIPTRQSRPNSALHAILKLEDEVSRLPKLSADTLFKPILRASIDLDLQQQLTEITRANVQRLRTRGAGNAAVIVLDRSDNSVLSWIGSDNYFDNDHNGAIDYARIKRSSGSTLKPFFYALGLERGDISAATLFDDIPAPGLALRNADMHYLGPVLPRQALANSRNVPVAQLVKRIGLDSGYTFLHTLKLHQEELPAQYYGMGIALGTLPVSLEDLVTAYTALADDGMLSELKWFENRPAPNTVRVLSIGTARQVSLFLSDPSARLPSFPRMGNTEYPFPVAVKTGTSQAYRDAWTVAFSKRYLVAAWVGDPDNRSMKELGGYGSAALIVKQVLMFLHNRLNKEQYRGQYDLSFPKPPGYVKVKLCASNGKLAGQNCEHQYEEWLKPEQVPQQKDLGARRVMVDRRNGEKASEQTPLKYRQLRTVLDLPPRYAVWASQQSGLNALVNNAIIKTGFDKSQAAKTTSYSKTVLQDNQPVEVEILAPRDGVHIIANPEIPALNSTIELSASVTPTIKQITWYVDGKPFKNADYPYNARLPLRKGEHTIQAAVPLTDERSKNVVIHVD